MSAPEPINPTRVDPEECNITETKDRGFKIAIMDVCKVFKEKMNATRPGLAGRYPQPRLVPCGTGQVILIMMNKYVVEKQKRKRS